MDAVIPFTAHAKHVSVVNAEHKDTYEAYAKRNYAKRNAARVAAHRAACVAAHRATEKEERKEAGVGDDDGQSIPSTQVTPPTAVDDGGESTISFVDEPSNNVAGNERPTEPFMVTMPKPPPIKILNAAHKPWTELTYCATCQLCKADLQFRATCVQAVPDVGWLSTSFRYFVICLGCDEAVDVVSVVPNWIKKKLRGEKPMITSESAAAASSPSF